ncbi:hypothetical protein VNO77_42668 [Canavalia gladiata]|uniref:Uncharacterized protein n=1 Tax=Canavalia gladiata TaxID=3824 RepID=A0AAN9JUX3_CANGL
MVRIEKEEEIPVMKDLLLGSVLCQPRMAKRHMFLKSVRQYGTNRVGGLKGHPLVVSISACHADDPGSIPGNGVNLFLGFIEKLLNLL